MRGTARGDEADRESIWRADRRTKPENEYFEPIELRVREGASGTEVSAAAAFVVEIAGICHSPDPSLTIGIAVYDDDDALLFWSYPTDSGNDPVKTAGHYTLQTTIPANLLNFGRYRIELIGGLHGRRWLFAPRQTEAVIWIDVAAGHDRPFYWTDRRPGAIAPVLSWSVSVEQGAVN